MINSLLNNSSLLELFLVEIYTISHMCHKAHYYLNYYLMVPMLNPHKYFYKSDVQSAFSVCGLISIKFRAHLWNEFSLFSQCTNAHYLKAVHHHKELVWIEPFLDWQIQGPLLREVSVCRGQGSPESSGDHTGLKLLCSAAHQKAAG